MSPETLQALKQSIEKWERNAKAATPEQARIYGEDCPLCALFVDREDQEEDEDCAGCPVAASTGQPHCSETPWRKAALAHMDWEDAKSSDALAERFRELATKEADFLRSLLPADEPQS